jgi:hypothetical protein
LMGPLVHLGFWLFDPYFDISFYVKSVYENYRIAFGKVDCPHYFKILSSLFNYDISHISSNASTLTKGEVSITIAE